MTIDPRPSQVWTFDLDRKTGVRLSGNAHSLTPLWTLDGQRVVFASGGDIFVRPADASSEAQRLFERPQAQYPMEWTRNG